MAATEVSFTIDWGVVLPIVISGLALFLSAWRAKRAGKRDDMDDMEKRIDKAAKALQDCEDNLKQCGREKDELRRENLEYLQQIARLSAPTAPTGQDDG